MPFEIVVDDVACILRARYSGELSLDARVSLARRVLEEAARTGIYRWLLDFREAQAWVADPADARRMADEFTPQLPDDIRMAYLLNYDHQLDDSVETVMRSRGVQVERFLDLDQAIAWLQAARPDQAPAQAQAGTDLHRALRLSAEETGADDLSPDQVASIGELVHDLLARGMDEATVRQMARRMSAAMRPPRG